MSGLGKRVSQRYVGRELFDKTSRAPVVVFSTVDEMELFLSDPFRRPGMLATSLDQPGKAFVLSESGGGWNPLTETELSQTMLNVYYVTASGDDGTATGSQARPFKTISAAMEAIGDATSIEEYRNGITTPVNSAIPYLVIVGPGQYHENVTIPKRQLVNIHLQGSAIIVGDVNYTCDTQWCSFSFPPRLSIRGEVIRSGWKNENVGMVGVTGDINFGDTSLTKQIAILDLADITIQGAVNCRLASGGQNHVQVYTENVGITQGFRQPDGLPATKFIQLALNNSSKNDGGQAIGQIGTEAQPGVWRILYANGVYFHQIYGQESVRAGVLFNSTFNGDVYLNGSTATFNMDSNSYTSLKSALKDTPTSTFVMLDTDIGVRNTSSVPGGSVKDALDRLRVMEPGDYTYWGEPDTEGAVRMGYNGTSFVIDRYESGSWVNKSEVTM